MPNTVLNAPSTTAPQLTTIPGLIVVTWRRDRVTGTETTNHHVNETASALTDLTSSQPLPTQWLQAAAEARERSECCVAVLPSDSGELFGLLFTSDKGGSHVFVRVFSIPYSLGTSLAAMLSEVFGLRPTRPAAPPLSSITDMAGAILNRPYRGKPRGRLLIVDDDRRTLLLVTHALDRHGFQVELVDTVEAAVDRVREAQFDAALVDIDLATVDFRDLLAARGIRLLLSIGSDRIPHELDTRNLVLKPITVPTLLKQLAGTG